jgi:hypothetical protein
MRKLLYTSFETKHLFSNCELYASAIIPHAWELKLNRSKQIKSSGITTFASIQKQDKLIPQTPRSSPQPIDI